jgi:3-oxoacyl-[acyl-carrier protein] reductase
MDDLPVMVITGTRTGLGRKLAEHYASHGYRVIGCSRGSFEGSFENYEHVQTDVRDERAVANLFSRARKSYGRLDVLINNAGTTSANYALLTPLASAREVLETNVLGTFLCCRAAVRLMMRRSKGHIINFSTIEVPLAMVGTSIYSASKSAVEQFTRILAKEVAAHGVAVNCLGLSFVRDTGMLELLSEDVVAKLSSLLASPAMLETADVVRCIDGLILQAGTSLTGETVYSGGI